MLNIDLFAVKSLTCFVFFENAILRQTMDKQCSILVSRVWVDQNE